MATVVFSEKLYSSISFVIIKSQTARIIPVRSVSICRRRKRPQGSVRALVQGEKYKRKKKYV